MAPKKPTRPLLPATPPRRAGNPQVRINQACHDTLSMLANNDLRDVSDLASEVIREYLKTEGCFPLVAAWTAIVRDVAEYLRMVEADLATMTVDGVADALRDEFDRRIKDHAQRRAHARK